MIPSSGKLCMRAFKNPCDGSFKEKLGNIYLYFYLLQYAKQLSIAINKDQCSYNVFQTCKSKTGSCKHIKNNHMHVFNCSRTLCYACQLFRQYNFLCYKMIFTEEPMAFQIYVKELLNLIQFKRITVFKNIKQTQHCYHSNEYQNHKKCVIFEPTTFMIYEYNMNWIKFTK